MGLYSDIAVLAGLLLVLSGIVVATGVIDIPGTNNVQVPGDDSGEPRYILDTSIDVKGTSVSADLDADSFSYDTRECNAFSCGSLSFTETRALAFGGAEDVTVNIALYNSEGVKVAEANKFVGDVGWFESNTVDQSFSNIEEGQYTLEYRISMDSALGDAEWERNFDVRVPETIAEGGGN